MQGAGSTIPCLVKYCISAAEHAAKVQPQISLPVKVKCLRPVLGPCVNALPSLSVEQTMNI